MPDEEVLEEDENVVITVVFLLQAVDGNLVVVPDAIDGDGVGIGALEEECGIVIAVTVDTCIG